MAKLFGKDTYLEEQILDHSANGLFLIYVFFILDISLLIFLWKFPELHLLKATLAIAMIGVYIWFNKPINEEIRLRWNYKDGLNGELAVQRILLNLPDSYCVFANVVIPGKTFNIDFIVVGPTGIFSIEVKSHKGKISFDGVQLLRYGRKFEHNFLWQAKGEAKELHTFLRNSGIEIPFVDPVLVFSNRFAFMHFGKKLTDGVMVLGSKWLLEGIQSELRKQSLSDEQIAQLQQILEKTVSNPKV